MRKAFEYDLARCLMAYEGLVSLTIGERAPVDVWARVFRGVSEPIEIKALPTRITTDPPEVLVHLAPERPDLPPDQQPPSWPSPFPPSSADGAAPYCRLSVTADGQTDSLDRLRIVTLEPVFQREGTNTWDALLKGAL